MRPLAVCAVLSLGLAASVLAGASAAAEGPGSDFSFDYTNSPDTNGALEFGGTKLEKWTLTEITVGGSSVLGWCSGTDAGSTSWGCSYAPAGGLPAGDGVIVVTDSNPGRGAVLHEAFFTVIGGTAEPPPAPAPMTAPPPAPEPVVEAEEPPAVAVNPLAGWTFDIPGIDLRNVHPGDRLTFKGAGLPSGITISAELHSTPVSLGAASVGPVGAFTLVATIPKDTPPGDHTFVLTASGAGLPATASERAVSVVAAVPLVIETETETKVEEVEGVEATGDDHGTVAGHGPDQVEEANILTHGLPSIDHILADPARIPAAFGAGLVLILLAVLPAHLLNATLSEQYERLTRRVPHLRRTPRWLLAIHAYIARAPVIVGLAATAITAFLFGLADPHFGFNEHSLRLFVAVTIALFTVTYLANLVTRVILKRTWAVDVTIAIRPLAIVITIVAVALSRVLEFSPGFLVGLVLGLSIARDAADKHAWKAVIVRASVLVAFALISWAAYSSLVENEALGHGFTAELVLEIFVAIATEGIVMILVELLPLHLLEGERLFKRSKLLWAGTYAVVLTVFILAVVPWEENWRQLGGDAFGWFAIVGGFAVVSVAIYLYFRFIATPIEDELDEENVEPTDKEPVAIGDDI
ncbi:hypothetical protein [Agromyces sp. Soil535]|uniref:hypothetical protein n=1 Tax=Agromyces sp. Soil535 TaxID=1736390 RepID=UPI000AED1E33|nr:hypothetical protein [Agromyces sp. Soil535]